MLQLLISLLLVYGLELAEEHSHSTTSLSGGSVCPSILSQQYLVDSSQIKDKLKQSFTEACYAEGISDGPGFKDAQEAYEALSKSFSFGKQVDQVALHCLQESNEDKAKHSVTKYYYYLAKLSSALKGLYSENIVLSLSLEKKPSIVCDGLNNLKSHCASELNFYGKQGLGKNKLISDYNTDWQQWIRTERELNKEADFDKRKELLATKAELEAVHPSLSDDIFAAKVMQGSVTRDEIILLEESKLIANKEYTEFFEQALACLNGTGKNITCSDFDLVEVLNALPLLRGLGVLEGELDTVDQSLSLHSCIDEKKLNTYKNNDLSFSFIKDEALSMLLFGSAGLATSLLSKVNLPAKMVRLTRAGSKIAIKITKPIQKPLAIVVAPLKPVKEKVQYYVEVFGDDLGRVKSKWQRTKNKLEINWDLYLIKMNLKAKKILRHTKKLSQEIGGTNTSLKESSRKISAKAKNAVNFKRRQDLKRLQAEIDEGVKKMDNYESMSKKDLKDLVRSMRQRLHPDKISQRYPNLDANDTKDVKDILERLNKLNDYLKTGVMD